MKPNSHALFDQSSIELAALYYTAFANEVDATWALDQLSPAGRDHPAAVELRRQCQTLALDRWQTASALARSIVESNPGDPVGAQYLAYCQRRLREARGEALNGESISAKKSKSIRT
ncbi:MAG: hypothetical protein KA118_03785 [Verrucomicrobia bacterium]|nr:hypothetical protein [Verrucomicrobiota bacterium]